MNATAIEIETRTCVPTSSADPTTSIVADFVFEIARAATVAEAFAHLGQAVEALEFESIVYTALPLTLQASDRLQPVFLDSPGFSAGFLEHYREAGLADHDFTIERARRGSLEVMDWSEERNARRLTIEQASLVDLAGTDYGIANALTIPTRSDAHVIAGASITSGEHARLFRKLKSERLEALRTLVSLFDARVFSRPELRRPFYSPVLDPLSDEEIRVIRLVLQDCPTKQIDKEKDGISGTLASNVRSRLFKKFGVRSVAGLAHLLGVHQIEQLLQTDG